MQIITLLGTFVDSDGNSTDYITCNVIRVYLFVAAVGSKLQNNKEYKYQ